MKIIKKLERQSKFSEISKELQTKKILIPNEGKKTDPAHPAIYPTGNKPKNLKEETQQLIERCLKVGGKAAVVAKHLLHRSGTLEQEAWPAEISRARSAALEEKNFAEAMRIYREERKPQI